MIMPKVYEESPARLNRTMSKVDNVSEAVGMILGLKKCAVAHARGGEVIRRGPLGLKPGTCVCEIDQGETYRYLGVHQLHIYRTRGAVMEEYKRRVGKWGREWNVPAPSQCHPHRSSGLNAKQTRMAHNTWAVPVCRYFFGVVDWSEKEVKKLDVETKKILRQYKCHYLAASPEKLYLPTQVGNPEGSFNSRGLTMQEGGRGLMSVTLTWEREVMSVASYLLVSEDGQVQGAVSFLEEMAKKKGRNQRKGILHEAKRIREKYHLRDELLPLGHPEEANAAQHKSMLRAGEGPDRNASGQAGGEGLQWPARQTSERARSGTHCWLREGKLKPETVSVIVAAQDGVTPTKHHRASLSRGPQDPVCRLCGNHNETLGHLLSKCKAHEHKEYTSRHNSVLYLLTRAVAEKLKVKVPECLKVPGGGIRCGVIESGNVTMLVDLCIPTDRQVKERKPDLVVRMVREKKIAIFEVAVSWDPKVEEREVEKRAKYGDLAADNGWGTEWS